MSAPAGGAGGEPLLRVDSLRKKFGAVVAVQDLTFTLRRGEILGLLGVNGAGKTTAIHMILGLITPTSGSMQLFGEQLAKHRTRLLRRVNFSSAYANLPLNLLVWQNLFVFAHLYGVPHVRKRIDEVLALFEISHLRNRVTGQLSSGESTRLNLCKALLNDPDLLVLDEPTASLDPDIADKVRKVLRKVQREKNMGVLYTSHNMRDVEEICDRIIFIHQGRILCEGSPREVLEMSRKESLEELFIQLAREGWAEP